MKKILSIIFFLILGVSILINWNSFKVDGKGWVEGQIILVSEDGDSFTVTIDDVQGYYSKDYSHQGVTFNKYDFTLYEDKQGNLINPYKLETNQSIKVFHRFINGHMVVIKIKKL